jgi:hypothetical protein
MDIFEFVVLSFCNLGLICWIVKRQGIASVEGYCAVFLGMAVFTDNVQLLFDYFFQPGTLVLGPDEFSFRTYPTIVHIVALTVLMAGLLFGNPKPEPIKRNLSGAELDFVAHTGVMLLVLGLIFAGATVYLTRAFSAANFFRGLDTFRGGDPGSTGGFFYRGADIAVFGMALILPSLRKKGPFLFVLLGMMSVSFFLRANKGGLELPLLWAALVMYTYNPIRFRSLVKPKIILACLVIALLGIGIKVELMAKEDQPWTLETLTDSIVGPMQGRWGDQGLYRGYCQFIESLPRYHYLFDGYREGMYALTEAWVPRALNPNKRTQPSEGLGFMIHADAHAYREETPSIELVGSVYADNGFYSLTAYLLIVGALLGTLRRYTAGRRTALQWHISYLCFALFQGLSAEAGIAGVIYTFLLTFGITSIVHLAVVVIFKRRLEAGTLPNRFLVPDGLRPL